MPETNDDAFLSIQISGELKALIEDAAALTGKTVSDFAVSTLINGSRNILMEEHLSRLSDRDRQFFVEMLEDDSTKPNESLVKAAKQFTKWAR